jgi:DNA-binding beta-propeller fold protein YncE
MSKDSPVNESTVVPPSDGDMASATLTPLGDPSTSQKNRRKRLIIVIVILLLLLAIIGSIFAWFAITKKPLTQLPVLSASTPPHYSATMYDVQQPIGVAVDEATDRVYVTQSSGNRDVAIFDTSGTRLGALKAPGSERAMHVPVYVAVDPTTSNVYVSDRATSTIYVYDPAGKFLRELKPTGIKTWQPMGLWFDSNGNLFATDVSAANQQVVEIAPDGTVTQTFGTKDGLSFPNGVATSADGAIYVADSNHSRVLMYSPDGQLVGPLARGGSATPIGLPRGVTIDDRGRIYIVDTTNQNIQVFSPSGSPTTLPEYAFSFGTEGTDEGSFEYPNGIATDSRSRIYITDRENNRLQVWSY